nr:DUF4365 domain-containing protein [Phytoactinopolyspora limicola]
MDEVSAAFVRLGWGSAANDRHDLGTDLFLAVRDERLFDLGLVVGAQVKAGATYFNEPAYESERLRGWWFRDSDSKHIDAWLSHALPHLIVLHDLESRTSYWQHVTEDAVTRTGKGAKVLVPVENTVDESNRHALLAVAATARPVVALEGSAWTGSESVLPRDLLRYALIVPRLVAPHPNAGRRKGLVVEQAIAMLVLARVRALREIIEDDDDVPSLDEAADSRSWAWRLVGRLYRRLVSGDKDLLLPLIDEAPDAATRAAATVVAVEGLLEEGDADYALMVLEATLALDEASPVDYAWLRLQHARACAEIGRVDDARATAIDIQQIRVTHPEDVTASAIAGAAAVLLFNVSAWRTKDVADVITGMDTAANWWRTQKLAWGLGAQADRAFTAWSRDSSISLIGGDDARNNLLSASVLASYLGDHGGWRDSSGLLGKYILQGLDRDSDPEYFREGLDVLRWAGDAKALARAVTRIVADGPAAAVTAAASDIDLERSTRTTAPTNLALLGHGGDVLDEAAADRSIDWVMATLKTPESFVERTSPTYRVELKLIDTLAGIVLAASPAARSAVVEFLVALSGQDQSCATSWARVVGALPDDAWNGSTAVLAGQKAPIHHDELRRPLLGIAARHDAAARQVLMVEAQQGSWHALTEIADLGVLRADAAANLVTEMASRVNRRISSAEKHSYELGMIDAGAGLALLNVTYPDVADWEPLLNLLAHPDVASADKRQPMWILAHHAEEIAAQIRPRLASIAATSASNESGVISPFGNSAGSRGPAWELALVLGAFDEQTIGPAVVSLLSGDTSDRSWVPHLLRRIPGPEAAAILVGLLQDPYPEVRGPAAAILAELVATGQRSNLAVEGLQHCMQDTGTRVALGIASTLSRLEAPTSTFSGILHNLRKHPSAKVRARINSMERPASG